MTADRAADLALIEQARNKWWTLTNEQCLRLLVLARAGLDAPPREPTTEMMLAGMEVQEREDGQDTEGVWCAMHDAYTKRSEG